MAQSVLETRRVAEESTTGPGREMGHGSSLRERLRATLITPLWGRPWPVWVGALGLGFVNLLMFTYARALGVFPQMSMWGAQLYNQAGIEVDAPFAAYPLEPLHRNVHSYLNFGIVLGVLAAALLSREFKIRRDDRRGYATALLGGILMGFGTVITPPCNVGGFFSATMALSLSGPLMALGLLAGAWVGGTFLRRKAVQAAQAIDFDGARDGKPVSAAPPSRQPWVGSAVLLGLLGGAVACTAAGMSTHAGLLLFGGVVGIIFQRSRLCFAAAFRDVLVSRNTTMMKWILLSIGLATVGFAILKAGGYKPEHFVLPVGLHTIVGGFIFGVGMVIAGGCGIGILWRSAEGYTRAWVALFGGMLAAGSWVLLYGGHVGEGWLYGRPVFLPDYLGWVGAVLLVFLFLGAFFLFLTWLETRKCRP